MNGSRYMRLVVRKFLPSKVWPNCQSRGATCQEVERRPSLVVTLKVRDWPTSCALVCQSWPQLRDIVVHPSLFPFTCTPWTSPAPATFHTSTRLKEGSLPAVSDRDDAGLVLGDLEEGWLGEVEVGAGGVAPATVVAGEGVVWGAVVGAADEDGGVAGLAPLPVVDALDLVAGAAG
ncbi:unnamed protein product [Spirodela intermedia]|nr:unnamed protein product [Spirodela intermedia]